MPCYKLCYFDARGFGEMTRLLFAEAGVAYEDVRYKSEEWPKHKPNMLFGQMPVLFVDGEQIAHSRAAVRYLAREFKLDGGSALNAAKMDMWIEVFIEGAMKLPFQEQDEEKKKQLTKEVMKDHVMPRLFKLEENMKGTYMFGEEPCAGDFSIYCLLDFMKRKMGKEFLENFPKVKAMIVAVEARPNIAKWIKERPETEN